MKRLIYVLTLMFVLVISPTVLFAADGNPGDPPVEEVKPISITYKGHSADIGWADHFSNEGEMAGTEGQSLQLEAIEFRTQNLPLDTVIKASGHVTNIGWMNEVINNGEVGTTGQGLALQAVKFEIVRSGGWAEPDNDIYYRAHVANIGWMGWAKNGEVAGTCGLNLPMEAIEIRIVPKGAGAPGDTAYHGITEEDLANMHLSYEVALLGHDPCGGVDGTMAGTYDENSSAQLIKAQLVNPVLPGSTIFYQTAVNGIGWSGWAPSGTDAGVYGNQIETCQFELHGPLANLFDIYYRPYIRGYGYMDWAKNGEWAGTMFGNIPILGIDAKLVRKGQPAPGFTYRSFLSIPNGEAFQGRGVYVSIPRQMIFLQNENSQIYFMCDCTTGTPNTGSATPTGNFRILGKSRNTYLYGADYVQLVAYWIPFIGQTYGFHDANGPDPWREEWEFGRDVYINNGSHGCVNMKINDIAKFCNLIRVGDLVVIR